MSSSGLAPDSMADLKSKAYRRLVETGEKERLENLLRTRLYQSKWKDHLETYCQKVVREKGVDNVKCDDVYNQVLPVAKQHVPDDIRQEISQMLKVFLAREMNQQLKS